MANNQYSLSEGQVEQLLSSPENQALEFKTGLRDSRQAAQSIAAMANSGGGQIVLGVGDDGEPIGLENPEQIRQIAENGAQVIEPRVPLTFAEGTAQGHPIVVANVLADDARGPFLSPSGAFVRRGTQGESVALSENELARAFSQGKGASTPLEQELAKALAEMNQRFEALQSTTNTGFKEAKDGRNWKAQLLGWILSGAIGAAIGAGFTAVLGS